MFEIVPRGYRVYPGADIQIPKRATPHSAGYDFYTPTDLIIPPHSSSLLVFTDVRVKLKPNQFLALYPRSSMGIKKGLQLSNTVGIIDSDYYNNQETGGNIAFKFYNHSTECVEIKMGEKNYARYRSRISHFFQPKFHPPIQEWVDLEAQINKRKGWNMKKIFQVGLQYKK